MMNEVSLLQIDHIIVRNQCKIKPGEPMEVELTDGTFHKGVFYQRWQKKNSASQIVLIENVGENHERLFYLDETAIKDIRLGPYGEPQLYRIK
ncbi:hypothetical protein DVH26_19270 [Paenibacillus sp. H1-7]|nr:hypothetical protein DVH26_19270 [Paenibacillus sp. H1-7]